NDNGLRNLLEQIFFIRGDATIMLNTIQGVETLTAHWNLKAFGLVIIDTAALGACESEQQRMACRLLARWTTAHPMLPCLLLGTVFQKYAILSTCTRIVRFVVKPCHLDDLVEAIEGAFLLQVRPDNAACHES